MKHLISAALVAGLLQTGAVLAQDDVLGLYFSNTVFSEATANAHVVPTFNLAAYIVLTKPTGAVISGYEVRITSTAAGFAIPLTNLFFDINAGSNVNQIVTYSIPKPALPDGTVLAAVIIGTDDLDPETISFGASSPSRLPGDRPVIDYGAGGLVACSQPFGTPVVAWLNGQPVANEYSTWGAVKATFR
jgi:hypothetical protein